MKKILTIVICLVLTAALLCGCGGKKSSVKIGVFEPLTGADSEGGNEELRGIELANELYPEAGGIKITLVTEDNRSDAGEAANVASTLVRNDGVSAVIGSYNSELAAAGGKYFLSAKIPAIGVSCTGSGITENNDYYFRVCYSNDFQGTVMAKYAVQNLGAVTAGIIYESDSEYSAGLRDVFTEAFESLGGEIVAEASYSAGDSDYSSQLLAMATVSPDVIFLPGYAAESAQIIVEARTIGLTLPFLGCDTWESDEFLQNGGSAVEGCAFSTFFDENADINETSEIFVNAYYEKYGEAPSSVAALGFDAYLAAAGAISLSGGTSGEEIRSSLASLSFVGVTGDISFDQNGDAVRSSAVIKAVEGEAFTYIDTVALEVE